ncbi:MAG TPA: GNAT family N-acetyltransferase [Bryobacteraceae bacterium]|nr:GNAT family N-acetyltransferase [Bryobacteraceae bacterium]
MAHAISFEIRQLKKHHEFEEVVGLQREIWGFDDVELLPFRLFVVADKIGGQLLGAFDGDRMVGFCLCIPGLKPGGKFYLHSHMLGVLSAYRNTGVGRQLKWKQRDYALERDINLIEWTFDPLEIKNAFFNIERLGATARRYTHNQYGTTSSHLHGGLPTDRLTAEWWIGSPRVQAIANNQPVQRPLPEAEIRIPMEIGDWKREKPERALSVQSSIAEQFDRYFRAGLAVTGFDRDEDSGTYQLSTWESS